MFSPIHNLRLAGTPDDWKIAFIYNQDGLKLGASHEILLYLFGYDWTKMMQDYPVFGWIYKSGGEFKVEIYSDTQAQKLDTPKIDEAFAAIRERYPVTELTYGSDRDTIQELSESFDDPRLAALDRIARQTS